MLASWVSIVSPYTQTQIPNYQLCRYRYLISASIYIQQDSTLKKPHIKSITLTNQCVMSQELSGHQVVIYRNAVFAKWLAYVKEQKVSVARYFLLLFSSKIE